MKLIADIGGTNARFAILDNDKITSIETLACEEYPKLIDAIEFYLKKVKKQPKDGFFAIAAPLDNGDRVKMMNYKWDFSIKEVADKAGLDRLKVINDFEAVANAIKFLKKGDYYKLGRGVAVKKMPIAVIGAGTGLGIGGIIFDRDGREVIIATEGGHVTMPAITKREFEAFEYLKKTKYSHISAERVVSGKGLVNIYNALGGVDNVPLPIRTPEEITKAARDKDCPVAIESLSLFCYFFGVVAGNLALTFGAKGGIYIAGGIAPKLGDYFKNSRFQEGFLEKGRYNDYLRDIPIKVITHKYLALEGLRDFG